MYVGAVGESDGAEVCERYEAVARLEILRRRKYTCGKHPFRECKMLTSTIHSALVSQRLPSLASFLKVCVTLLPVDRFSNVAVPLSRLVAFTVALIWSPGETSKLLKLYE